jgi:hypothetical protein
MSDFYSKVMGQPTITYVTGTKADSGANTLVASPGAGYRLVVLYLQVQNETTTATTCIIKWGTVAVGRVLAQNQGDGLLRDREEYPMIMPEATALVLDLSGANSHGYTVEYVTMQA